MELYRATKGDFSHLRLPTVKTVFSKPLLTQVGLADVKRGVTVISCTAGLVGSSVCYQVAHAGG